MEFANYQAAPEILERLKTVKFVAVVGPSGAGKSTLIKHAMESDPDIHYVLTTTSRARRPGENDDVDYHFRNNDEILDRLAKRELVQVAPQVLEGIYATAIEDYSPTGFSIMAVLAQAMPSFRQLPFEGFRTIYVVPPSFEAWLGRLGIHEFSAEQKLKRFTEAQISFNFGLNDPDTTFVINDDLATAQSDFLDCIHGTMSDRLQNDQARARACINEILGELTTSLTKS